MIVSRKPHEIKGFITFSLGIVDTDRKLLQLPWKRIRPLSAIRRSHLGNNVLRICYWNRWPHVTGRFDKIIARSRFANGAMRTCALQEKRNGFVATTGRTIGVCSECGKSREIKSGQREGHPLCATCDQAERRRKEAEDDRNSLLGSLAAVGHRRYVAERNKMFVNLARIKQLVDETPGLSYEAVSIINAAIYPYLHEQVETLRPHQPWPESTVNAETESTVDSEQGRKQLDVCY
jgi:hypothetical protein